MTSNEEKTPTLPRSPSSPSPPSRKASRRADSSRKAHASTRRQSGTSGTLPTPLYKTQQQGWSTSYQAGSSSSESDTITEDDDTDDDVPEARGRRPAHQNTAASRRDSKAFTKRPPSLHHASSQSGGSRHNSPAKLHERKPFTRSRSPVVRFPLDVSANGHSHHQRTLSPSLFARHKHTPLPTQHVLPSTLHIYVRLPFMEGRRISCDIRQALENSLLLCSLGFVAVKIRVIAKEPLGPDMWISIELSLLVIACLIYCLWTRFSSTKVATTSPLRPPTPPARPASPRLADTRESKKNNGVLGSSLLKNNESAFVWMTVPKNYRNSLDDGVLTGLIGGPLIAAALLYISLHGQATSNSPLLFTWLVEPPIVLKDNASPISSLEALLLSRRNLVNQSTFCATILLVHVCASWVTEARHRRKLKVPEGEVSSVPRKQGRRTYLYCLFTISVSLWILCVRIALAEMRLGIWQNMNYFEVVVSSVFFQLSLYISMRLAHRGFTFGELGLVCFGATVLFMEMLNLTIARLWPITTTFIKTYRLPTPLLMYQIALIPGSLLTGFLLSPLLYLSRHIAQRPVRRLRYPQEKQKHRRLLALGFYLGAVLIVGGLLGLWTRWCLGNRDPWLWVIFWTLQGRKKWTRPALLAYWVALISISVAGWNRQLARSRRYRHRNAMSISDSLLVPPSPRTASGQNSMDLSDPSAPSTPPNDGTGPLGLAFPNLPNLPNLPNGSHMSNVATDLLDAADKHVPTLGVNARRKFFHALAVVMFVPGIAVDPAFTHLSFSVAFALFTFAEYVRYFALYPFGASVHLFMNEFLDQKDSGTAILSHFYLLTGCANSVWFEGPSRLLLFTGTLVLGVGDALASIVGKRLGKHRWFAVNPKTVEGSAAFVVSVVTCAWLLWLCGFTEDFSIVRYTAVAALSAGLEAFSVQNDNLTLPLYMWSMLVFADVCSI